MDSLHRDYGDRDDLVYCEHAHEALQGADGLIIMTEWTQFRSPDFNVIKETLGESVIFDGRNLYDPEYLKSVGIDYYGIGRGNI